MSAAEIVRVGLGDRSYDIVIGPGLLASAGAAVAPFAPSGRVFVVTDANVAPLHLPRLEAGLAAGGLTYKALTLPPGEAIKSYAGLAQVCDWLIAEGVSRKDIVVAFGGGVIGDLAGFAAGIVKRGVEFVQIPTTLLAQVDSSVGGKTAIDTAHGKNLVGLFHQPKLVLADLDVLKTLPERELRCGYAEIVKYGLIDMPDFYDWCEANAAAVMAGDPAALTYAVKRSVEAKARVVALDEREEGPRALLNLGHTFAHAFEAEAGFDGALLHGEAVGAGMALAFEFSARQGLCERQESARVGAHLARMGFGVDVKTLAGGPYVADALVAAMAHDKKNAPGKLTLILARGIGGAFVDKDAPADAVRAFIAEKLG